MAAVNRSPEEDNPRWSEIIVGLAGYIVLLALAALVLGLLPHDDPVLLGVVSSTMSGFVCIGAFAAAYSLRIRSLRPFGFKPVGLNWLMISAALGFVGYGLSLIIQTVYALIVGDVDPQGVLHAAARGGTFPFIALLLSSAVITPFGEELLFRGVVANALNRYGSWAGIGLSSVIFGLAHGISVILPLAIMVGLLTGILFYKTGSVWPGIVLHSVYNGIHCFASALGFAPVS